MGKDEAQFLGDIPTLQVHGKLANPKEKLTGCELGEGDCRDCLRRNPLHEHHDNAAGEYCCLARARAGFNEQRSVMGNERSASGFGIYKCLRCHH